MVGYEKQLGFFDRLSPTKRRERREYRDKEDFKAVFDFAGVRNAAEKQWRAAEYIETPGFETFRNETLKKILGKRYPLDRFDPNGLDLLRDTADGTEDYFIGFFREESDLKTALVYHGLAMLNSSHVGYDPNRRVALYKELLERIKTEKDRKLVESYLSVAAAYEKNSGNTFVFNQVERLMPVVSDIEKVRDFVLTEKRPEKPAEESVVSIDQDPEAVVSPSKKGEGEKNTHEEGQWIQGNLSGKRYAHDGLVVTVFREGIDVSGDAFVGPTVVWEIERALGENMVSYRDMPDSLGRPQSRHDKRVQACLSEKDPGKALLYASLAICACPDAPQDRSKIYADLLNPNGKSRLGKLVTTKSWVGGKTSVPSMLEFFLAAIKYEMREGSAENISVLGEKIRQVIEQLDGTRFHQEAIKFVQRTYRELYEQEFTNLMRCAEDIAKIEGGIMIEDAEGYPLEKDDLLEDMRASWQKLAIFDTDFNSGSEERKKVYNQLSENPQGKKEYRKDATYGTIEYNPLDHLSLLYFSGKGGIYSDDISRYQEKRSHFWKLESETFIANTGGEYHAPVVKEKPRKRRWWSRLFGRRQEPFSWKLLNRLGGSGNGRKISVSDEGDKVGYDKLGQKKRKQSAPPLPPRDSVVTSSSDLPPPGPGVKGPPLPPR